MTSDQISNQVSGYVPFYNNRNTVLAAIASVADQDLGPIEVFAMDDGSTDGGLELLESHGFRCLSHSANEGRGAVRHQAMLEADGEIVVCCDATNILPRDFVSRLLPWFDDSNVAAVYGWIQDPMPHGAVGRWRARHLFKAAHSLKIERRATLITYGTILRRAAVLQVGNFNRSLSHSEDTELGKRLLQAGYDIISDPSVPVFCNVQNSLWSVLERYCRWYFGDDSILSFFDFTKSVAYIIKVMVPADLRVLDLEACLITLLLPFFRLWRSRRNVI